jgi:hypothetical protein
MFQSLWAQVDLTASLESEETKIKTKIEILDTFYNFVGDYQKGKISETDKEILLQNIIPLVSTATQAYQSDHVRVKGYRLQVAMRDLILLSDLPQDEKDRLHFGMNAVSTRNLGYGLRNLLPENISAQFNYDQVASNPDVVRALREGTLIPKDERSLKTARQVQALNSLLNRKANTNHFLAKAPYLGYLLPIGIWSDERLERDRIRQERRQEEIDALKGELAQNYPDWDKLTEEGQQSLASDLFWRIIDHGKRVRSELDKHFPDSSTSEQLRKWHDHRRGRKPVEDFFAGDLETYSKEGKRLTEREREILNTHLSRAINERKAHLQIVAETTFSDKKFMADPGYKKYLASIQISKLIEEVQEDPSKKEETLLAISELAKEAGLDDKITHGFYDSEESEWAQMWNDRTQSYVDEFLPKVQVYASESQNFLHLLNQPEHMIGENQLEMALDNYLADRDPASDPLLDPFLPQVIAASLGHESAAVRLSMFGKM